MQECTIYVNIKFLMSLLYNKATVNIKHNLVNEIKKSIDYKSDKKIIDLNKKFSQFKRICENSKLWDSQLAAYIDLSIFISIYEKMGIVIDKFIQDNKL